MIHIIKTNDKFLIGSVTKSNNVIRMKIPFEITESKEGIKISPLDVRMIQVPIPYIEIKEYEYMVKAGKSLSEFYKESSEKFIDETIDKTTDEN